MKPTTDHVPSVPRISVPRLLVLAVFVACTAALAACRTTEGFGKDVKHLGGDIEDSAAKNK